MSYAASDLRTGVLHLGLGRFMRAHQAWSYHQAALAGDLRWGVAGVSLRSAAVRNSLRARAGEYSLWIRDAVEAVHQLKVLKQVLVLAEDYARILEVAQQPDLQLLTLTVTEKGYALDAQGELQLSVVEDRDLSPEQTPMGLYGLLAAILRRWHALNRRLPVISCDNLSENGPRLRAAVLAFLQARGESELADWVASEIPFPASMVDRIVPATRAEDLQAFADQTGLTDAGLVVTEGFSQWVVEDCAGLPELPGLTRVASIAPYAARKLRLLNAAHSLLAYRGLLEGHQWVHQAFGDERLRFWLEGLWNEAAAMLGDPIACDEYCAALRERFSNARLPHALAQIAADGSVKLPQRILTTLQERRGRLSPFTEFALLSWCEYVSAAVAGRFVLEDPQAAFLRQRLTAGTTWNALLAELFG